MTPRNFESDRRLSAGKRLAGIDRRIFLARASVAPAAAVLLPAVRATRALAADAPVAETTSGKIRGVAVDRVNAFKGVPYGAPTGGRARFIGATQARTVGGVRSARRGPDMRRSRRPTSSNGPSLQALGRARHRAESEDCLTLNVFTPALAAAASVRHGVVSRRWHGVWFGNTPRLDGPTSRLITMSWWSPSITASTSSATCISPSLEGLSSPVR